MKLSEFLKNQLTCKLVSIYFISICFQANLTAQSDVEIMTWNIKMLPKICNFLVTSEEDISNKERVDSIISIIRNSNVEIIQLQESFQKSVVNRIVNELRNEYPYSILPQSKPLRYSNGLLILSKFPLKIEKTIFFKQSKLHDCMVSKGAVLCSIDIHGDVFYIVNTHLQSDYDLMTSESLRKQQLIQIQSELIDESIVKNNPLILAGDFNFDENSSEYSFVKKSMDWSDISIGSQQKLVTFNKNNSWNKNLKSEKLDYIFVRNGTKIPYTSFCQMITSFKKGYIDISDHYPLTIKLCLEPSLASK